MIPAPGPGAPEPSLVAHDYFAVRGGAERVVLELCRDVPADLLVGFRTPDSYGDEMFPANIRDLDLPKPLQRQGLRVLALAFLFSRQRAAVARYKTRIFSGVAAPFAAPSRNRSTGRSIFYCHAPPRFLYDQRPFYRDRLRGIRAPIAHTAMAAYRSGYEAAVARMDVIVANSKTVQSRVRRYLGRDSTVIYPPCDTTAFAWRGQQNYYLSTARLLPLKRVDRIIDAFLKMPDKRLVVASHGEEIGRLRARAGAATNITFVGATSEADFKKLIGEAIATIYVPIDEDFGMSPVESMSAGKPCISVAEGGPLETLVAEETGLLLKPDFQVEDLVDAVRWMTPSRALAMRPACEARARLFAREKFIEAMREIMDTKATA